MSGRSLLLGGDRTVKVSEEDAALLIKNQGWVRVEPPKEQAA